MKMQEVLDKIFSKMIEKVSKGVYKMSEHSYFIYSTEITRFDDFISITSESSTENLANFLSQWYSLDAWGLDIDTPSSSSAQEIVCYLPKDFASNAFDVWYRKFFPKISTIEDVPSHFKIFAIGFITNFIETSFMISRYLETSTRISPSDARNAYCKRMIGDLIAMIDIHTHKNGEPNFYPRIMYFNNFGRMFRSYNASTSKKVGDEEEEILVLSPYHSGKELRFKNKEKKIELYEDGKRIATELPEDFVYDAIAKKLKYNWIRGES